MPFEHTEYDCLSVFVHIFNVHAITKHTLILQLTHLRLELVFVYIACLSNSAFPCIQAHSCSTTRQVHIDATDRDGKGVNSEH